MTRNAARALALSFSALYLATVPSANAGDKATRKNNELAEKVARKVEKALRKAHEAEQEPADREALHKFHKEVAEYAELRAKQLARLGEPAVLDAQASFAAQRMLAHSIQSKRAKARQGDIFVPAVVPMFRRLIAAEIRGPDGLPARKAILEGNPGQEEGSLPVVVRVNGEYAIGAALSTVPSSVLLTLPPLPEGLQYRFVGRHLILLDCAAGLIVDFLPIAAPALAVRR